MTCPACGDCSAFMRRLVRVWYPSTRAPRRPHDEVVREREERAQAIAFRREFNRKKRAEREARKLEKKRRIQK